MNRRWNKCYASCVFLSIHSVLYPLIMITKRILMSNLLIILMRMLLVTGGCKRWWWGGWWWWKLDLSAGFSWSWFAGNKSPSLDAEHDYIMMMISTSCVIIQVCYVDCIVGWMDGRMHGSRRECSEWERKERRKDLQWETRKHCYYLTTENQNNIPLIFYLFSLSLSLPLFPTFIF